MRILIEAHHPAHIHFWKYPIRELLKQGHKVLMIARDRDVMCKLLEAYDWIPARIPRRWSSRNRLPLIEMLQRQLVVMQAIHEFRPDVVVSLMGSYTQSAKLFGIRNVIFTDTETQEFNHRIAHPFADEIHTPHCFLKDLGHKQVRYKGLHELMFLHPEQFTADPSVVTRINGLSPGNYIVIRMSAWNTFHDRGRKGIGDAIYSFVERFEKQYRIVLSAEEGKIPPGLEKHQVQFHPADFHHILSHAKFVLTEGASTATEAACLGVPAVFINSVGDLGNFKLLDEQYRLLRCYRLAETGVPESIAWLASIEGFIDHGYNRRYREFLNNHPDRADYLCRVISS